MSRLADAPTRSRAEVAAEMGDTPGWPSLRAPRLASLLLVALIAGAGTGCGVVSDAYKALSCILNPGSYCGDDSGEITPPVDCLPKGPAPCGPPWDRDNDTISTNTETDPTNSINNLPGGFYSFDVSKWDLNLSQARGVAINGSLFKGMNLTDFSTGYIHYDVCEGMNRDDWGTGHLVRLIEYTGRQYVYYKAADDAEMQVGDLSLREGGYFPAAGGPNCQADHHYHRQGLDVDLRYLRKSGNEDPLDICAEPDAYDQTATFFLIYSLLLAERPGDANVVIDSIFVDLECLHIDNPEDRTVLFHRSGHRNHFHVRIRDPDGTN